MSVPLPPLLVVDDEKNMRLSLQTLLGDEGYAVRAVESAEDGLKLLGREECFMVITDARLGGMSGYDFLPKIRAQWPELPVLMITAYATPKLAVEVIKAGAMDYLDKPFAPEELLHAVERCAERHRLLRQNAALRARAGDGYQLDHLVGEAPKMRELRQMIQRVAPSEARVLILGESGTGKELVAGALHSLSHRHAAEYVRINCAAIQETLLESELFGHEKGAFTGALRQKPGRVEEADDGTIFLDEIADMSRPLQAKLLRFLEDGTFTRVGGTQELRVNVRLLAATNRDLAKAIAAEEFREDLLHRLNVVQLRLPPLRERGDDVLLLAKHFLKQFNTSLNKKITGLTRAAQQKLLSHQWPGNVRELRNVIERAVILETQPEVQPASLPDFQLDTRPHKAELPRATGEMPLDEIVATFERDLITQTLEQNHFSLTRCAEHLKLSRHALRYRMQRLHINTATDGDEDAITPAGQEEPGIMKTIFLADALNDDPIPGFSGVGDAMKQHLILLGALLLVAVVLIAWAYLSRRTRRKSARREERRHRHSIREAAKGVVEIHKYVKERQGGRRREHRPRNPTLAETGGLPPIRSDTPPPPTSPR